MCSEAPPRATLAAPANPPSCYSTREENRTRHSDRNLTYCGVRREFSEISERRFIERNKRSDFDAAILSASRSSCLVPATQVVSAYALLMRRAGGRANAFA